jgi:cobalt-zinc-cadmium resistance protein CzcA
MIRRVVELSLSSPLIVLLLATALAGAGIYAFLNVNVEAYPDPAPAIVEIVAQFPGASAEEVERQVTVPLEVTLAGMPHLQVTRSKSLFGLAHLRNQFEYGYSYNDARQEVINRLQFTQPLPPGVSAQISPQSPTGEIYRYTLRSPQDPVTHQDIYTLNDLKALQDWVLEREFRRVPRIADVTSSGGTVKRYEINPDPNLMRLYGVTLSQIQSTLQNSNANIGGDVLVKGKTVVNLRGVGLIGGGTDPMTEVLGLTDRTKAVRFLEEAQRRARKPPPPHRWWLPPPYVEEPQLLRPGERERGVDPAVAAARYLRYQDNRRIHELRQLVITSLNSKPVLIDDIVEGGRARADNPLGRQGVVVGHQTRQGRVSQSKPAEVSNINLPSGEATQLVWRDENDKVQCIVLLRKDEHTRPALQAVKERVAELNDPENGRMLPGVEIETYYDRGELVNITTETVRENLLVGMFLVIVILLMFLSNVRTALIVAVNIPLALLFAFAVLFFRGKSANLLSIGAVDFGIIVDSSVIMVENIYRHVATGEDIHLPLRQRILKACDEISGALFFSTLIMVCAFLPLFTMSGPEGQLFGPMAQTYAFALGGALVLAIVLSPVLCLLFFKGLKPAEDNFLVRWMRSRYLANLERCLRYRKTTLVVMGTLLVGTIVLLFTKELGLSEREVVGREFMPELEEGNLWITATFPLNTSMDNVADKIAQARKIMSGDPKDPVNYPGYPEIEVLVPQIGRPDDGTDPTGYYRVEIFAPMRPNKQWPRTVEETGWRRWVYGWDIERSPKNGLPQLVHRIARPRTKEELVQQLNQELRDKLPGIDWNFSQYIRDNVTEAMSGVKGDNSVKIFGPDLDTLDKLAEQVKNVLRSIPGVQEVAVFSIMGQTNLEFRSDPDKCKQYGVSTQDVNNVIQTAVGGKAVSTMIEGEKTFDITVRFPKGLRSSETDILDLPVDIVNNQLVLAPNTMPSPSGSGFTPPALTGSPTYSGNPFSNTPQLRLRDLVSPVGHDGSPDPFGSWERPAASTIYREQGKRFIAVKFNVRGRDLAGAVAEAKEKVNPLIQAPYRAEWAGEFQEMEEAETRLMVIVPVSLAMIMILLYMAFHSWIDSIVVLMNVVALSMGGIWALAITGTNFSISAAVGFISIFGVAIMDGLLLISYFNQLRAHGATVHDAIIQGAGKRVRAVTMTALTAIFGLLPAAFSTRIGAQTQRPLAIVVVGGMITTLLLTRYLMPVLYSFYGHREVAAGAGAMAH